MKKQIPYEKLSKKARRAEDRRHRGDWGGLNPVTRTTRDLRRYDRRASRIRERYDDPGYGSFVFSGKEAQPKFAETFSEILKKRLDKTQSLHYNISCHL